MFLHKLADHAVFNAPGASKGEAYAKHMQFVGVALGRGLGHVIHVVGGAAVSLTWDAVCSVCSFWVWNHCVTMAS